MSLQLNLVLLVLIGLAANGLWYWSDFTSGASVADTFGSTVKGRGKTT